MKRLISICLTLAMAASMLVVPTSAASESEMIQTVQMLGIMIGDEKGNMNLTQNVTRAQFTTMAVRATPAGDSIGAPAYAPFPDVKATHWSAGYVAYAVKSGYINGYTDGTFLPDNQITLAEGVNIVRKLLGYTDDQLAGSYPSAQMNLADQLGLLDGVTATDWDDILDRGDAMTIFYNALTAKTPSGQVYLTTLGYALDSKGEVDITALLNATLDGPVIAEGDWETQVTVNLDTATIYRDGKIIKSSQISDYDVVYWNENLNTAWVYFDRVSGTVQSITPNATAPTAVMVAGQTYPLSGSDVIFAFSQMGSYSTGDAVTLLLGRDGSAVGVADTASTSTDKVGMVTATSKGSYDSGSYTADTITLLATDGKTYSYPASASYFDAGDLVRVTTTATGSISLSRLSGGTITGTVSQDGTSLGKYDFAKNIEILDVYTKGTKAAVSYQSRLAGVTLDKEDILYCQQNDDGEITHLVLNDVTGDLHDYAVITEVVAPSIPGVMSVSSYYYITMGAVDTVLTFSDRRFTTKEGPAKILGGVADTDGIAVMTEVAFTHTSGQYGYNGNTSYRMADDVQVYEKDGSDYYLTTLDRAQEADLSLTGYYDKPIDQGGLIRIVIGE